MSIFRSAFGELTLTRWPPRKLDTLQAWDAADEHLLNHLSTNNSISHDKSLRILVINDAHGTLCCALHGQTVVNWSDSCISHQAVLHNSEANTTNDNLSLVKSTMPLDGTFDLVLIKVPKTNALLEDQLIRLKPHITGHTEIIAAAMIKHLQKSAFELIEKIIGPLTTSLAVKKSRLIFTRLDNTLTTVKNPYPSRYTDPDIGFSLINHANVFSRSHLDLGSRFFLSMFKDIGYADKVVDLACGNGVLGIEYQLLHPQANLEFIDESYMAIASAEQNYRSVFTEKNNSAMFIAQDGLTARAANSCNLILCNPPFHQQHSVGDQIATAMFRDAKHCLKTGGSLWLVSNHHLDYKSKLKRLFGHCQVMGKNKKFVVLKSVKR